MLTKPVPLAFVVIWSRSESNIGYVFLVTSKSTELIQVKSKSTRKLLSFQSDHLIEPLILAGAVAPNGCGSAKTDHSRKYRERKKVDLDWFNLNVTESYTFVSVLSPFGHDPLGVIKDNKITIAFCTGRPKPEHGTPDAVSKLWGRITALSCWLNSC